MILIPARVASKRFPKKVLEPIYGEPMVIKTAKIALDVDRTVIATDSQEVIDIAKEYNIEAILTSSSHKSGTDRIYEAVTKIDVEDDEAIINLQADEPFIEKDVISKVLRLTIKNRDREDILINSCYKEIDKEKAEDKNIVKVVTDDRDTALYFSRAKIPFIRDDIDTLYKAHIGIYGFTKKSLETFCNLENALIEDIEKLEQLRALYFGYKIAMVKVKTQSFGIDTKEDLEKALMQNPNNFK